MRLTGHVERGPKQMCRNHATESRVIKLKLERERKKERKKGKRQKSVKVE
jgi:hypothetical protein